MKLPRRKFLHLAAGAAALPAVSRIAPAQSSSRHGNTRRLNVLALLEEAGMARKIALAALLLLCTNILLATAQQPNSTDRPTPSTGPVQSAQPPATQIEAVPSPPPPSPNAAAPSPGQQGGNFPSKITVDFVNPPGSGSSPWLVVLGAVLGAGVTALVAYLNTKRTTDVQAQLAVEAQDFQDRQARERARHEKALAWGNHEHEKSEATLERQLRKILEDRKLTMDEKRVQIEYEKMQWENGGSSHERWTAARKFVHDKQAEEAKLIHLYFDKLLSKQQPERDLALFALSAFLDSAVVGRLALAGKSAAWRSSVSRLAARGNDAAADAAQGALNADAIEYRKSVVLVYVSVDGPMVATGFFSEPSLLITCIAAKPDQAIFFQSDPASTKHEAKCLAIDDTSLIVVARIENEISASPLALRNAHAADAVKGTANADTEALALTLQWSRDNQPRFVARVGTITDTLASAEIVREDGAVKSLDHLVRLDVSLEPGSAGAPVLDEDGHVLGVVISGPFDHNFSYAVKAEVIKAMLDAASQPQEERRPRPPVVGGGPYAILS